MIELPYLSVDLIRSMVQNFTIIATLVLLYNYIPDTLRSRSKLTFSLGVGAVFGLAAAISMPDLWQTDGGQVIGFNLILVPLSGFISGPVSSAVVAAILLTGCILSGGYLTLTDSVTIMSGVLLGALFYAGKSRKRFPRSPLVQFFLMGSGVALIEFYSSGLAVILQGSSGPLPPGSSSLIVLIPFLIASCVITVLLGYIIGFIDRRKLAEKELLEYRNHLEDLVRERTTELRDANSLQKATIESTADGIVVVDREGMVRAYNHKASRILDLPALPPKDGQVAGMFTTLTLPHLAAPEEFLALITALAGSAEQVVTTDLRFRNGTIYELYVQPQLIGTRSVGRVWSFHDITKTRRAEDAIKAANSKLVLLAGITRHDILNQMTALVAYLELLKEKTSDPANSSHLETMGKILDVIRLQLEFTRDYQDLGVKEPAWQDIHTIFLGATEAFADNNIRFRCEGKNAEIYADPLIGRAFYNLIDNSLRHGERITEISLVTEKTGPDLFLVYTDNGVGVPAEEKEKIFIKGFGKHTGLGMFLIREILSITGIAIRENGIPGQGVRFEIRVPSGKFRFL